MNASLSARPLAADILAECGYGSFKQQARPKESPAPSAPRRIAATPPPMSHVNKTFKLPELKSATREEAAFRAYFLAMAVINNHKMMMSALAERFSLQVESKPVQDRINRSVKILACASLFLIGLESGGISNDKSAMEMLFASLRVVEKVSAGSTVKELVRTFGSCQTVEFNKTLCHMIGQTMELNFQSDAEIESFVCSEFSFRKEISTYACKQDVTALREQVVCFL